MKVDDEKDDENKTAQGYAKAVINPIADASKGKNVHTKIHTKEVED